MSAASAKPQEPSMEEILSSIRRIIADDQNAKAAAEAEAEAARLAAEQAARDAAAQAAHPAAAPVMEDEEDVLDLAEMSPAAPVAPAFTNDFAETPDDDIAFRDFQERDEEPAYAEPDFGMTAAPSQPAYEPEPAYEPAPSYAPQPASAQRVPTREERLLSAATDQAVANAFGSLAHTILSNNARTLDDIVTDMLRPMLKVWLDDNLPTIVERLVRAEIERVARGGRN